MVQGKYGSISYKTKRNRPRPREDWYRVTGTHEPIIDRDLRDRVQAMVADRTKPFGAGRIGLFARKVRCANCGYTMRSTKSRGRRYLQCSNRHVAKDACTGSFISVDRLEQMVVRELNGLTRTYLDQDELDRNVIFNQNPEQQKTALPEARFRLRKQVEENRSYLRTLYMDKVKGLVSSDDYIAMANGSPGPMRYPSRSIGTSDGIPCGTAAGRRSLCCGYSGHSPVLRASSQTAIMMSESIRLRRQAPYEADPSV